MAVQPEEQEYEISIVEAVETLTNIIDADFGVEEEEFNEEGAIPERAINWLKNPQSPDGVKIVQETFGVVLDYLRNFYRDEYHAMRDDHTLSGIKSIMLLVGEAAKKLDKESTLKRSVTQFKEYRELQEFYQSRVSKKIDEALLGKWILGLAKGAPKKRKRQVRVEQPKRFKTKHFFIDLESVKQDLEYELFQIRKEDGLRFFNPRLIRNMKLTCDFSKTLVNADVEDPFYNIKVWQDRCMQASALGMIKSVGSRADHFYKETAKYRQRDIVVLLNKALMSLLLSSHSNNLLHNEPTKCCLEYFCDFQRFLVQILHCREYERLVAYPPTQDNHLGHALLDVIHALCRGFFIHLRGYQEMIPVIEELIAMSFEGKKEQKIELLWQRLALEYKMMEMLLKKHPNGPLVKVLERLESGKYNAFAPIRQENLPMRLYSFYFQDKKISNVRLASPTYQEVIDKVIVADEFIGYLRACLSDHIPRKHLLINLQDNTSWREAERSRALEKLPEIGDYGKHLTVVTLATDTEFYHQQAPYADDRSARILKEHFLEHLMDDTSGYFFPEKLYQQLFPDEMAKMLDAIHRIFFSEKNVLSKAQRLDFIEITYLFLTLKCLDILSPDSFSFTCKDAVDVGGSFSALLFTFIHLINGGKIDEHDLECLHYILFAPPLLNRERLMLRERFHRFISALRAIESVRDDFGGDHFSLIIKEAFALFFSTIPITDVEAIPPKH